ncbi:MAG: sulfite exporter TauE/SafE family protein, partial [Luteimonas sp.]
HDHAHDHAHEDHHHAYPQWLPLPAEGRVVSLASRMPVTAMTAHHAHVHHSAAQSHAHSAGELVHSHGGSMHSHLPPGMDGEPITWRGLLALGISGGLVPCPSAMVLLLAAVALHKTAYGLLLVLAFSFGLAVTLTLVGLAFLYARNLFPRIESNGPWSRALPIVSAGVVTLVGLAICYGAIVSNGSG